MSERCHTEAELAALTDVRPGDPRRAHVDGCPRCRARLVEYHAFIAAPPEVPARDLQDADARLGTFLDREVAGAVVRSHPASDSLGERLRAWWRSPVAAPALAMASVLVLAGGVALVTIVMRAPRGGPAAVPEESVMRGDEADVLRLAVQARAPEGGARLRWSAVPAAERYEVQVFSATLEPLTRLDAARDTVFVFAPERLAAIAHDETLLVSVRALRGGAPLAESRLEPLIVR